MSSGRINRCHGGILSAGILFDMPLAHYVEALVCFFFVHGGCCMCVIYSCVIGFVASALVCQAAFSIFACEQLCGEMFFTWLVGMASSFSTKLSDLYHV